MVVMQEDERKKVLELLPTRVYSVPACLDSAYKELLREGVIEVIYSPDGEDWVCRKYINSF